MKIYKQGMVLGLLWGLLLLIPAAHAAAPGTGPQRVDTPMQNAGDEALKTEYQDRALELATEIQELKENLTWLELNIQEMRHLNKPVPYTMVESVAYKKSRIRGLEATYQEVSQVLDRLRGSTEIKVAAPAIKVEDAGTPVAGNLEGFQMIRDDQGLMLKSTSPIRFPSGSAVINKTYYPMLQRVSEFVRQHRAWILVDGYADIDPIRTKMFPSNFELGAVRAANVVHALVRYGADPSRFKIASTGEYRFPDARPRGGDKALERYVNITIRLNQ